MSASVFHDPVIDIGRHVQLLVDDHLLDLPASQPMVRTMHTVERHPANPLIVPEFPFERQYKYHYTWDNGSVIYDPRVRLFRAYFSQAQCHTLYAQSEDGIHWQKPELHRAEFAGTKANNILLENVYCTTVCFDLDDARAPYRMYALQRGKGPHLFRSDDGLNWHGEPIRFGDDTSGDSAACVYDPYQQRHIAVVKTRYGIGKQVTNPLMDVPWEIPIRVVGVRTATRRFDGWTPWREALRPDDRDHQEVERRYPGVFVEGILYPWRMRESFRTAHEWAEKTGFLDRLTVPPQAGFHHAEFMNMIVLPYHGLYLGLLQVLHTTAQVFDFGAKGAPRFNSPGQDGTMDVQLVASRDLVHWQRLGDRVPFIPLGERLAWDQSMIMPFTSNAIVRDGRQWFYFGGSQHSHRPNSMWNKPGSYPQENQGLGLATLRQDGFVSLDAGAQPTTILTRPLRHAGRRLILNADARDGTNDVEVCDESARPIPGYEHSACHTVRGDSTRHTVTWRSQQDLPRGEMPIRLRFHMRKARLYSLQCDDLTPSTTQEV